MSREDRIYKISTQYPRGYGIVIVNKFREGLERQGADQDQQNLTLLFRTMGLEVHTLNNVTKADILSNLRQYPNKPELEHHSMLAIGISSHGCKEGILGIDVQFPDNIDHNGDMKNKEDYAITIHKLKDIFNSVKCRNLAFKPKLFIINGCRGTGIEEIIQTDMAHNPQINSIDGKIQRATTNSDFLILYSCVDGYYSYRSSATGSLYITSLYRMYLEHGNQFNFQELLPLINKHLIDEASEKEHPQTQGALAESSQWESTCTRLLFLPHLDTNAALPTSSKISATVKTGPQPTPFLRNSNVCYLEDSIPIHSLDSNTNPKSKASLECVWSEFRKLPKDNLPTFYAPYHVHSVTGMVFDKLEDRVYILDSRASRIWLFDSNGDQVQRIYDGIAHQISIIHDSLASSWGIAMYNDMLIVSAKNMLLSFRKYKFKLNASNTFENLTQLSGLDISEDGIIFVSQRKSEKFEDRDLIIKVDINSLNKIGELHLAIPPATLPNTKILDIKCKSLLYILFIGQYYNVQVFNYDGKHCKNLILSSDLVCGGYFAISDTSELIAAGDLSLQKLRVFDKNGSLICSIGSHGNDMGCFLYPTGIVFDNKDRIIIACNQKVKNVIQCFKLNNYAH